jgi:hypothetical protein
MTMIFAPGWEKPKLATIPDDATLATQRANLSNGGQRAAGIHPSQIKYAQKNNALREADAIFLTFFDESSVRAAVQKAQTQFKHEATINTLLADMIGAAVTCTVDQGTHQAEDRSGGGFKLHFDVRRPDRLCFHFYVGQNADGTLKLVEISYMNAGSHVSANSAT